jgi:Tol biopolymer transport system component
LTLAHAGLAALLATAIAGAGAQDLWAAAGDTVLVSRATGANGAKANVGHEIPQASQLSLDGRYATFSSGGSNLDPADTDRTIDVFLRDLRDRVTTLVSRADGALGAKGNGDSTVGDAAAGGRYVVFNSLSSNLDPADPDTSRDIYLRDVLGAETTLVSRADGVGGAKANGEARRGRISADGRFVAFDSAASNLDPGDADTDSDVFVRDLVTSRTTLVTDGVKDAELVAFSDDAQHIAYLVTTVPPPNGMLVEPGFGDLYVQDLRSGTRALVSANVSGFGSVSLSADGRYVAFSAKPASADPDSDPDLVVYVGDVDTGTTRLVGPTAASGGSLSADGRYVAFSSYAFNLDPVDGPSDHIPDTFVRDLRTRKTTLASRFPSGAKGDRSSVLPALSGNGRFMVFTSGARFERVDTDHRNDVYVRDLGAPLPPPGRRPRSSIRSVKQTGELGQGGFSVTGRATDDGELQVVEVSLTRRLRGGRCQRWDVVWAPARSRDGRCVPRFDFAAHFTRRWWRRFDGEIRPGTYELLSRAIDTAGQREAVFSTERGNRRVFRVR